MHPQQARRLGEVAGGASIRLRQAFWCEFLRDWLWRALPWRRTRLGIEIGIRRGGDLDGGWGLWPSRQTPWQDAIRARIGGNQDGALGQRRLPRLDIPGARRELRALFDPLVERLSPNDITDGLHVDALQHVAQFTDVPGP